MTKSIIGLLLPMLAFAASAQAQTSSDRMLKIRPGKTIFVTTLEGEELRGTAGTAAPGTITVWTGAAIGGGVGLLLTFTGGTEDDPMLPPAVNDTLNAFAVALAVSGSALIGWGIDALIKKRKTIYVASAPQPRSRASLVIKGRMVGLAISF